jgi:integrase
VLKCPECGSSHVFKDGFRKAPSNALSSESIQRYRCADYGHRWSEHITLKVLDNHKENSQISVSCRIAKNLTSTQKTQICAEKGRTPTENELKAVPHIEKFLIQLQSDGRKQGTLLNYRKMFKRLLDAKADLLKPESCKAALSKLEVMDPRTKKSTERPVRDNTKKSMASMLDVWFEFNGIAWKKPTYRDDSDVPYVPTEADIDLLIAGLGKKLSIFCQILKDTGARPGEIDKLTWNDIDFAQRKVSFRAEKGSNPRTRPLTEKTIEMLCNLPHTLTNEKKRMFANADDMRGNFFMQKKRLAQQLANGNIQKISFKTFRHWKGTTEQHKTKDIYHVKNVLGHKSIKNTEKYIHLEEMIYESTANDQFTVKVADTLEEAVKLMEVGFEYHAEVEGHKLFRKRA